MLNSRDLISALFRLLGPLKIEDRKTAIPEITNQLLQKRFILSCDGALYLVMSNLLMPITERKAHAIIRGLLPQKYLIDISSNEIKEALERARDAPELQIDIEYILNKNKFSVMTLNGVFDAETGEFETSDIKSMYLYRVNFNYVQNASLEQAPAFKAFIDTSLGSENTDVFLQWLGYTCTSDTSARKAAFFIGPEQCGKSILTDVMENALGSDNTASVPFSKLGTEQSRIKYQGKIANISRETSAEPLRNDDAFKSIISGDRITGRRLYENSIEFNCYTKFSCASNFFPNFRHMDTATLDRIIPIYFKDRISNDVKTDFHLKEKLISEKDVIFSMALDKLPELIHSGYQFSLPERSKNVLIQKRKELLNITEYIKENFDIAAEGVISSVALYQNYNNWCSDNGIAPEGRNSFYSKVIDYSNVIKRGKYSIGGRLLNGFKGLRAKCDDNSDMYDQSHQDSPTYTQPPEGGDEQ